jgi:tetratricopeptide (TPR) repeat protein
MKRRRRLSLHFLAMALGAGLSSSPTISDELSANPATADHLQAGFAFLQKLQPDRAIACFTPLLIHAAGKSMKDKAAAQTTARYFILIGRAFIFDDNVPAAVQAFETARALDPQNEFALAYLADSLNRSGHYDQAGPLYKLLEDKSPRSLASARILAVKDYRGGELAKAKAMLKSVASLKQTPGDWKWHNLMGSVLSREGDTTNGATQFKMAIKLCPDPYLAKQTENVAAGWQLRFDQQEAWMREAGKILPNDGLWRTNLAGALLAQPNKDAPVFGLYSEAVKAPRFAAKSFFSFGSYLLNNRKREQQARQCAAYFRKLAPWDESLYRLEGQIYSSKNDKARAQKCYDDLLRLHPHLALAYTTYANFCLSNQLTDKQLEVLQQCVKVLPGCANGWRMLGELRVTQGKWDDAKMCFEKALQLMPQGEPINSPLAQDEFSRCHAGLGAYYYRANDRTKAQQEALAFNQLKYVPNLPALLKLVVIRPNRLALSGMTKKDRQVADHVMMADMLYQTHDYQDCIKEYKKAIELSPDDTDLHSYLYAAYNDAGNYVAAAQEDFQLSQKLMGKAPHAVGKMLEEKKPQAKPTTANENSAVDENPQAN